MNQEQFNSFSPLAARPLLIVISGLAGVGKDTILKKMKERRVPFHFVITTTTRKPRPGVQDGVDYFFITHEQFNELIAQNKLLEYAMVYCDLKGVPRDQVDQALASGQDVVMRIDVQGAASIRKIFPDAVLIFITTQNESEFENRLRKRGTETEQNLKTRIETARRELECAFNFNYIVANAENHLDETVDTILAIIRAEHHHIQPTQS